MSKKQFKLIVQDRSGYGKETVVVGETLREVRDKIDEKIGGGT